ncbi:MAG: phage virion morphogenesis protein [Aeromonas sp.]
MPPLTHALESTLGGLLAATRPAARRQVLRELSVTLRKRQSARIAAQQAPDGSPFAARKKTPIKTNGAVSFIHNGEERTLKNWRHAQLARGAALVGVDSQRNVTRSFYRADISRFTQIKRVTGRPKQRKGRPMFARLRQARYLRAKSSPSALLVGWEGRAAAIAAAHQFGLAAAQSGNGSHQRARLPRRELLGLSAEDSAMITETLAAALARAAKEGL